MKVQRLLYVWGSLVVLCSIASACAVAPPVTSPAPTALPKSPTSVFIPSATTPPVPPGFPPDQFLFVEVWEERVRKSVTGGQTTSFAGEQTTYRYDADAEVLSGTLEGSLAGAMPVVVGYTVVNQIDRNKAAVGLLYVLPDGGKPFGLVVVQRPASDGRILFTYAGRQYVLLPGESARLEVEQAEIEAGGGELPAGQAQHSVTITNHGFLARTGLTVVAP